MRKIRGRGGQVTIFIIIAIVLVAAVGIYFLVRPVTTSEKIPSELQGVYSEFSVCLEDNAISGIKVLESQGGYIKLPEFVPGSEYMPFSSQLNFLGNPVPYWNYVSGNNIEYEQVPSVNLMENELEEFIEAKISNCVPESLNGEYEINADVENSDAVVSIKENEVQVNVKMDFNLKKEDSSVSVENHKIIVQSELGNLYDNAIEVYNAEQEELFLENYSVDALRLYAPVDGVEISCAPKIWFADEVFYDLENAIQDNLNSLKSSGNSNDYFVVDSIEGKISDDVYVKFMNSKNWPRTYEVNPSEGATMVAHPVGNQQGLGVLGFCYVPYHYVYDVKTPVMVQIYSEKTEEFFQFPVAVIIENNNPRVSKTGSAQVYEGAQICENKNTEFSVRTYDSNMNRVDSEIYYECFGDNCYLGESENGEFNGDVPQCVNGYFVAKAEGYKDTAVMASTISSGSMEIIMDKKYEIDVELNLDNKNYNGDALVVFENSDGSSQTLVYPSQKTAELSEGNYKISVYVYKNSNLTLGESVQEYCVEVPRAIGGSWGLKKEECFDVSVPEQLISNALAGGGKAEVSFSESDLLNGGISINAESLPAPNSLNQIQDNYVLYESKNLEVEII